MPRYLRQYTRPGADEIPHRRWAHVRAQNPELAALKGMKPALLGENVTVCALVAEDRPGNRYKSGPMEGQPFCLSAFTIRIGGKIKNEGGSRHDRRI